MRLDTILIADAAQVAGGKLSMLGAWVSRITAPGFPWQQPVLAIVVRAYVDPEDFESDHRADVRVEDPEGTTMHVLSFEASKETLAEQTQPWIEGEAQGAIFIAQLQQMPFERPGLYQIVVLLDGEEAGRYPLALVEQPREE